MEFPIQPTNNQESVALVKQPPPNSRAVFYGASPYGFEAGEDSDDGSGLFEYWSILCRNKGKIFLSALCGLTIGFLVGIPMKSVYRARTSIEILSMNQEFMNMKETNPVNISMDSDVSEEQTQAELLSSSTMIKRVTQRLIPPSPQSALAPPQPRWRVLLHLAPAPSASPQAILIGKIAGSLKVKARPRTRILDATVESSDPHLAATYLNTLAEEFIQQNQESRLVTTEHTGDWLTHELATARDKLRKSEDALQEYARNSGIILANESTNVATEKLQQYQQSLTAASAERMAKQSRMELAQSSAPETLADVLNDGSLRETQSKITDLKRQIADLSTIYSPEYKNVRRLEAELQSLQTAFDTQRADILSRIRTDYQEAARKERLLADAYQNQTREVTGQGEKSIQYNILKREVDSNRMLYDAMLQQMKQASIATAMRASNVRIVDPADVPNVPFSPNFLMNSAVGLLAGLFLSSVVVLIRSQLDRTLQQPGDIKSCTDLTELGAIPNASIEARKRGYSPIAAFAAPSPRMRPEVHGLPSGEAESVELTTWQRKPGLMAEAFRSALTSILFAGENGDHPHTLLFTSANASDGKTTVVSNLALAAAEIRLKVLILDADLRRPRMHLLFDLPNAWGLSDLLLGDLDEADVSRAIQSTSIPNLDVLTAGTPTDNAAHLLYSRNLSPLLVKLAAEYDIVLIDSPPMLQISDARIVARQADSVVLVARAGQTSRDALLAAKQRLDEDRIPVLGSLLNSWDPNRSPNKYYGSVYYAPYSSRGSR